MNELPDWVQYVQALGPTIVAVIAAFIAGYIAWRQWRTAHYRLCLDMYHERFKVYEAVKNIINTAYLHGGVTQRDLDAFYEGIRGAEFLFDGRTKDFVVNIRQMAWMASNARARRQRSETDKLIDEEQDILDFLSEQAEGLEGMFKPYLDLSKAGLKSYWPWGLGPYLQTQRKFAKGYSPARKARVWATAPYPHDHPTTPKTSDADDAH